MIPRDLRKKQKDAGFYRKMVEKRWNVMTENPLGYEKISKLFEKFCHSKHYGNVDWFTLQHCGPDFYWSGYRISGKCCNQCLLSIFYDLSCNCAASWNWQCFSFFAVSWKSKVRIGGEGGRNRHKLDGNFRTCLSYCR